SEGCLCLLVCGIISTETDSFCGTEISLDELLCSKKFDQTKKS
ncbi:28135_t:CDS:1, partial [Dentiscutata erythropus]